eukprot:EG_transcript_25972
MTQSQRLHIVPRRRRVLGVCRPQSWGVGVQARRVRPMHSPGYPLGPPKPRGPVCPAVTLSQVARSKGERGTGPEKGGLYGLGCWGERGRPPPPKHFTKDTSSMHKRKLLR